MEILIVRHAIAGARDPKKWPDDRGRPLTPEGIRRFRRVARHLGKIAPRVDGMWASPLARAWQTAEILEREAGWPAPQELSVLEPDEDPAKALAFLAARRGESRVAIVGHEPALHELLSLLLGGSAAGAYLEMKKGGAALVRCEDGVRAGAAQLLWLLPPRVIPGVEE